MKYCKHIVADFLIFATLLIENLINIDNNAIIAYMNSIESIKHPEVSEKFATVADILTKLQWIIRENAKIDTNWKIQWMNEIRAIEHISIQKQQIAQKYLQDNRSKFIWAIDIQVAIWAIVCTYDSRKSGLSDFKFDNRGTKKPIEINWEMITIIWVDINPGHRDDNVSPTTSLHHEYQHHLNTTLGDAILFREFDGKYISLERSSDTGIMKSKYRSRSEFTGMDHSYIRELFWREIDIQPDHPAKKTPDYERYENQMYYLDELSAHYGQASSRVFWPNKEIYNNLRKWTHYELIWDNPRDKQDLQELYREYLMPWIYLPGLIQNIEKTAIIENRVWAILGSWTTWEWQNYLNTLKNIQFKISQILGISRTVHQAKISLEVFWKDEVMHPKNGIRPSDIDWLQKCWKQLEIYL